MNEATTQLAIEPIWEMHTQQAMFRQLMDAMARPGSIKSIDNLLGDSPAHRGVMATLLDNEVSLADPHRQLDKNDWPLLQARSADAECADYILCHGQQIVDFEPRLGTLPSPDFSATLVIIISRLDGGQTTLKLTGPGIPEPRSLQLDGLHPSWLDKREDWNSAFPLGVDMILCDAGQFVALSRTTRVEVL